MIGALVGDIVGSTYEFNNIKTKIFTLFSRNCRFTDDSVMTIAIFKALKDSKAEAKAIGTDTSKDFSKKWPNLQRHTVKRMQEYGRKYPEAGFGNMFKKWIHSENPQPYNSYGNGSAMRVSSVAYFAENLEELKFLSHEVTAVTHNHPEGLKGAEATAVAIWMAKNGASKEEIKKVIETNYYSLDFDYEDLRKNYTFCEICQKSVPQAIYCFLIGKNFEDVIRTVISIGGDCDTTGAIAGSIAEGFYGVPEKFESSALSCLKDDLKNDYYEFTKLFPTKINDNKIERR